MTRFSKVFGNKLKNQLILKKETTFFKLKTSVSFPKRWSYYVKLSLCMVKIAVIRSQHWCYNEAYFNQIRKKEKKKFSKKRISFLNEKL